MNARQFFTLADIIGILPKEVNCEYLELGFAVKTGVRHMTKSWSPSPPNSSTLYTRCLCGVWRKEYPQIPRLCREFHFNVQYIII